MSGTAQPKHVTHKSLHKCTAMLSALINSKIPSFYSLYNSKSKSTHDLLTLYPNLVVLQNCVHNQDDKGSGIRNQLSASHAPLRTQSATSNFGVPKRQQGISNTLIKIIRVKMPMDISISWSTSFLNVSIFLVYWQFGNKICKRKFQKMYAL